MDTDFVRSVFAAARANGIVLLAAGLAFHVVNMLIPLLVFAIIAITTFGWAEQLLELLAPVLGSEVRSALSAGVEMMGDGTGRRNAAIIAAVILAWSAFTTFQSVNMAFGHVHGVRAERSLATTALETMLVLATVALAAVLLVVVHIGLAVSVGSAIAAAASVPILAVTLFGTFVPMFARFSPSAITVRESLPGAALAAVAWTACALGFRLYIGTSEGVQLYGVAGAVMLLLTWVYLAALALLVGVVLNAVLADRVDAADQRSFEV